MSSTPILLSRELLQLWLQFGDTKPLPTATRRAMEQRFAADFSDVRLHTGPVVEHLCQSLHARALTFGNNLLFADGEFAPDTAEGRWLLAHELAHVLQQRAAAPATRAQHAESAFIALGDTNDACEAQADAVAAEAMDGAVRTRVTPDFSGAMRMTPMAGTPLPPPAALVARHIGAPRQLRVVGGRDAA
jgi:hypothetical protein